MGVDTGGCVGTDEVGGCGVDCGGVLVTGGLLPVPVVLLFAGVLFAGVEPFVAVGVLCVSDESGSVASADISVPAVVVAVSDENALSLGPFDSSGVVPVVPQAAKDAKTQNIKMTVNSFLPI